MFLLAENRVGVKTCYDDRLPRDSLLSHASGPSGECIDAAKGGFVQACHLTRGRWHISSSMSSDVALQSKSFSDFFSAAKISFAFRMCARSSELSAIGTPSDERAASEGGSFFCFFP